MSVKHGYYEQFYPQNSLSGYVDFQIYSSEDFIDLTSIYIDLQVIVDESNIEIPNAVEGLSYENCVLNSLFR